MFVDQIPCRRSPRLIPRHHFGVLLERDDSVDPVLGKDVPVPLRVPGGDQQQRGLSVDCLLPLHLDDLRRHLLTEPAAGIEEDEERLPAAEPLQVRDAVVQCGQLEGRRGRTPREAPGWRLGNRRTEPCLERFDPHQHAAVLPQQLVRHPAGEGQEKIEADDSERERIHARLRVMIQANLSR